LRGAAMPVVPAVRVYILQNHPIFLWRSRVLGQLMAMKPAVVLKFGGTSLADRQRILQAASIVVRKRSQGFGLVVVVSARAKQTDGFLGEARSFTPSPAPREIDMLLSSGERISAALFSIALNAMGCPAVALSGSQAGIITDDNHTNARIIEIRPFRVREALQEDRVAVVGGFQGVSFRKDITTLGRGGSDVTAVALASSLGAEVCEIYSDVDGVYTADPNIVEGAKRLDELSYQEMQEMGEAGARVLHPGSVEFAKIRNTIIHARSTFEPEGTGTFIKNLEGRIKPRVVGVTSEEKVVLVHVHEDDDEGLQAIRRLLDFCSREGIRSKQIAFYRDPSGRVAGSLIIPEKENYHIESILADLGVHFPSELEISRDCGAVSLIGTGITDRYHYLQDSLRLLSNAGIRVGALHTSSFRISLLIDRRHLAEAVRIFHRHFIEVE
jgi:aspartate kinase